VANVCSNCGEQNAPDAQFCVSCRSYLGWQDPEGTQVRLPPVGPGPAGPSPDPAVPGQSGPSPASDVRDAFEAGTETTETTVTIDGAPTTVTVNVANTSTLVDRYVVAVVDPPSWLEVTPGSAELLPASSGTVVAQLRIVAQALVPAQTISLAVRVSNTTGRSSYRDLPVIVTVPVVTAPIGVRAEPAELRVRDSSPGVCRVIVSNTGTNRWAQVQLTASDPEQVVRATWGSARVQVPPGGEESVEVRLDAPPPAPGAEMDRTITIAAHEGHRRAETVVTLHQAASQAAIDLLELRLDPSILRLGGRHRGRMTAVVDNRRGTTPIAVALTGQDPEKSLRFQITPGSVRVEPGQEATASVSVTAPGTPPGQEVIRALTVTATDGQSDTSVEGRVIQLASSRRGIARIVLTVLGGLLMFLGAVATFVGNPDSSAYDLDAPRIAADVDSRFSTDVPSYLQPGGATSIASIGLLLTILAVLAVFGLTGTTGKLTRVSAILGLVVVVVGVVGSSYLVDGRGPAGGAFIAGLGCVVAYAGGLFARR